MREAVFQSLDGLCCLFLIMALSSPEKSVQQLERVKRLGVHQLRESCGFITSCALVQHLEQPGSFFRGLLCSECCLLCFIGLNGQLEKLSSNGIGVRTILVRRGDLA